LEAFNLSLGLTSRGEGFSQELAAFDLLMDKVNLVILLLHYWITIINMDLCLSLNEYKPLLANIALDTHNLAVH